MEKENNNVFNKNNLEICLLKQIDDDVLNQVYSTHSQKLGEGYLGKEHFKKIAQQKQLIVAFNKNEVVGYLIFKVCKEIEFFKDENLPTKNLSVKDDNVLVLKTMAVKYEKCGIGTMLTEWCINRCLNGVKTIYCPVWKSKYGANAERLLENCGFERLLELKNFWYESSLNIQNFCPVCNTPCQCSMELYKKQVDSV